MPLAGQIIRASDVRRYLASNSRTTALGSAVITETTIAVDVSITLTSTRRVKCEIFAHLSLGGTVTTSTFGQLLMRRNSTGSAVATSDTLCDFASVVGVTAMGYVVFETTLAAGTYAFGALISNGSATNINLGGFTAPQLGASLTLWDMGDT